MVIQFFPGHMNKARRQIEQAVQQIDVVVELLDARAPQASSNPLFAQIVGNMPVVRVLNKSDLADPDATRRWLAFYERAGAKTVAVAANSGRSLAALTAACKAAAPKRGSQGLPVRLLVVGIPNTGKSTLVNALAGKRVTRVGNEPGITRSQQRVRVDEGLMLLDTPGVLWPRFEDQDDARVLSALGSIRDTVFDSVEVAVFVLQTLSSRYPGPLMQRYKLRAVQPPFHVLLESIGRQRGCLRPGGHVDLDKAAAVVLQDLRNGRFPAVSLQVPPS